MTPLKRRLPLLLLLLASAANPAHAQTTPWTDAGYLIVTGALQLPPRSFAGTAHPLDFAETATVETTYKGLTTPNLGVEAGVRVWRNLALGGGLSWNSRSGTAAVEAQVPHPFLFGHPRVVTGEPTGLAHMETAVHIKARWVIPSTRRRHWQVDVAGGPSLFFIRQDVVQDVTIAQSYPYDTATFTGVVAAQRSRAHVGFSVATDVTRMVARRVALGLTLGFSHASVDVGTPDGGRLSVNAGGLQAGASLRVVFPHRTPRPRAVPPRRR